MNKQARNIEWLGNTQRHIGSLLVEISVFGVLVAWGVELLVKTVFSLS